MKILVNKDTKKRAMIEYMFHSSKICDMRLTESYREMKSGEYHIDIQDINDLLIVKIMHTLIKINIEGYLIFLDIGNNIHILHNENKLTIIGDYTNIEELLTLHFCPALGILERIKK